MKVKLTPWFPPEIKPVRKGYYNVGIFDNDPRNKERLENNVNMYWNGKSWKHDKCFGDSAFQNRWWRGILKE